MYCTENLLTLYPSHAPRTTKLQKRIIFTMSRYSWPSPRSKNNSNYNNNNKSTIYKKEESIKKNNYTNLQTLLTYPKVEHNAKATK